MIAPPSNRTRARVTPKPKTTATPPTKAGPVASANAPSTNVTSSADLTKQAGVGGGGVVDPRTRTLMGADNVGTAGPYWASAVKGNTAQTGYSYWTPGGYEQYGLHETGGTAGPNRRYTKTNELLTPATAMGQLSKMNPEELKRLQSKLYMAGHYNQVGLKPGELPHWGTLDTVTIKAAQSFFTSINVQVMEDPNANIDTLLDQQAGGQDMQGQVGVNAAGNATGAGATAGHSTEVLPVDQIGAEEASVIGDKVGQDILGRNLTDKEKALVRGVINAHYMARGQREASARKSNLDAQANANATAAISAGVSANGDITPGTAGSMAATLTGEFGMKATSADGRPADPNAPPSSAPGYAYDFGGTPAQSNAFMQWAKANAGPGKLFKSVSQVGGGDPNAGFTTGPKVHVEFNTAVSQATVNSQGQTVDQAQAMVGKSNVDVQTVANEQVNPDAIAIEEMKKQDPTGYATHTHIQNYKLLINELGGQVGGVGVS